MSDLSKKHQKYSGHESVLNFFKRYKKPVVVYLTRGSSVEGVIRSFDKYTISLYNPENDRTYIFFKSAIECFFTTESSANSEEA